jgi:hypothetical protein
MTQSKNIELVEICEHLPELAAVAIVLLCREAGRDAVITKEQFDAVEAEGLSQFTVAMDVEDGTTTISVLSKKGP